MSKELTPWFPGGVKPARKGWYEVGESTRLHHNNTAKLRGRPFRFWSGRMWLTASPSLGWSFSSIFGTHPCHQWRGLAKKP
jgi:hypothetical protein